MSGVQNSGVPGDEAMTASEVLERQRSGPATTSPAKLSLWMRIKLLFGRKRAQIIEHATMASILALTPIMRNQKALIEGLRSDLEATQKQLQESNAETTRLLDLLAKEHNMLRVFERPEGSNLGRFTYIKPSRALRRRRR